METKSGRVFSCGVLLMLLALRAVTVDSAVVEDVKDRDLAPPCVGANCALSRALIIRGHVRRQEPVAGGAHVLPQPRRASRVRRQMVVVEVEKEESSHRLPCTAEEAKETACLNGECYALNLAHLRSPFCHCPAKYEGSRCEMLSAYYFNHYYAAVKKGAIIGGVVVFIILIIVAVSVYCSYRKGKRRRKERKNKPDIWDIEEAPKVEEKKAMMDNGETQL